MSTGSPHTTRSGHGWGLPPTTSNRIPIVKLNETSTSIPRWEETVEEQQIAPSSKSDDDDEKKPEIKVNPSPLCQPRSMNLFNK